MRLIVNYNIQIWGGYEYRVEQRACILEFENVNEISNDEIKNRLPAERGAKTILQILKLNE